MNSDEGKDYSAAPQFFTILSSALWQGNIKIGFRIITSEQKKILQYVKMVA